MTEPRAFQQKLGWLDATMIVAGSMIGSGIFIVSADIARSVGSPAWLLAVWLLTGVMTVVAALCYGELAGMMPHVGGQYIYLREAFGPLCGFLYGWTLFLVIQTGTIAAVAVAFSKFLGVIWPWASETHILCSVSLNARTVSVSAAQLIGIGVIALLTAVNCLGITAGKIVQDLFTFAKVTALAVIIVLGLTVGYHAEAASANWASFWGDQPVTLKFLMIAGAAMVGSLFSSDAWNNVTFAAAEVRNPRRNLPLSLATGTGLVIALYLMANVAYLVALPLEGTQDGADVMARGIQYATNDRVGTALIESIFGWRGASIMAVAIMISTFGCQNGLILAGARVYYAMAQDGLFFKSIGRLNRCNVPAMGLVVQGIWASLLTLSGTYNQLLDYVIFAALLFYVLTVGGIFVLRRTRPDAERPYRAIGYPVIPALYIILAALIMVVLLFEKPTFTWPGLLIVLTGVPVYFVWRGLARRA
jgi:APA family basic amino acid/polyamine antiporter